MAKCKNTIINEMVEHASEIMESHMEYNEIVAELMEESGIDHKIATATGLRNINERIKSAIELMREFSGCWA